MKTKKEQDYWERTEQDLKKKYENVGDKLAFGNNLVQFRKDKAAHEKQMQKIRKELKNKRFCICTDADGKPVKDHENCPRPVLYWIDVAEIFDKHTGKEVEKE